MLDHGGVFARSPPLCVLEGAPSRVCSKVRIYVEEPLVQRIDLRKLAASCALGDFLLQLDHKTNASKNFELREIKELCEKIDPSRPFMSILRDSGILDCFPNLKQYLGNIQKIGANESLQTRDETSGSKDHLGYVALINELLTVSNQISEDIDRPHNHKYMAHQVALLYQCINHIKGDLKPFKKRIEERFNGLKNLVENGSEGGARLMSFYKSWLRDLLNDIKTIVSSLPPDKSLKWT